MVVQFYQRSTDKLSLNQPSEILSNGTLQDAVYMFCSKLYYLTYKNVPDIAVQRGFTK